MDTIKGIDKKIILREYEKIRNVWKVGLKFGISGQTIYEFLNKEGAIRKMNIFSEKEKNILINNYSHYRDNMNLKELAQSMNRTVPFICRKAKELGLTSKDKGSLVLSNDKRKIMSDKRKEFIRKNGHNKGMLNKNHSEYFKIKCSERMRKLAEKNLLYTQQESSKQELSERMSRLQIEGKLNRKYRKVKQGWAEIGCKKCFFRSSWEYNIALMLQYEKERGSIEDWQYEPTTFKFEYSKDGILSYTPDFKILKNSKEFYYIEVKGWFDKKSHLKIKKLNNEHPQVVLLIIDKCEYDKIKLNYKDKLPLWDSFIKDEFKKCMVDKCEEKSFCKNLCRHHYYKKYNK